MTMTRTMEDVAKRAVALCLVAMYADDLRQHSSLKKSRMFIAVVSEMFSATEFLSPSEKAFIMNDSPDSNTVIGFVWMYECLNIMMYALSYHDHPGEPESFCDIDALITIINQKHSFETFLADAKLRSPDEIEAMAEQYAHLTEKVEGNPEIVTARRRALNWLTGVEEIENIW